MNRDSARNNRKSRHYETDKFGQFQNSERAKKNKPKKKEIQETPKVRNPKTQSKVAIDEYGQLKRKKNWESSGQNLFEDIESENSSIVFRLLRVLFRYLQKLFTPRSVIGVVRLVLFLVFMYATYWSASSLIFIYAILVFILACVLWGFIDMIILDLPDNGYLVIVLMAIYILFLVIILVFHDKNNKPDTEYKPDTGNRSIYEDYMQIDSTKYIITKRTQLRDASVKNKYLDRYDTCIVVAIEGRFLKAITNQGVGYVSKFDMSPFSVELLRQMKSEDNTKPEEFEYNPTIVQLEDEKTYQRGKYTIYWGTADKNGLRSGLGSYQWLSYDKPVKIYIGEWVDGMMMGFGIFFNYQSGEYQSGIWEYNNLAKPLSSITPEMVQAKLDSTTRVEYEMRQKIKAPTY